MLQPFLVNLWSFLLTSETRREQAEIALRRATSSSHDVLLASIFEEWEQGYKNDQLPSEFGLLA